MNREYTRAPHRRAQASPGDDYSPNAALLIDFDNVTMGIRSNLGQEVRRLLDSDMIRGKVSVQRAYADWRRYPQYVLALSEASIDLIYAPAYGSSKKNATDIRLAIDALELVFTRPEIGTFILLSGDSDFSSLVLKLKEYGKYVIGVGLQESSSDILVQNCDEYYSYNTISGLTSADEMPTGRLDPWELVDRAMERMVSRKDVLRSDRLKQVMLELDSTFDEKEQGFSKFNKFLAEAARRELVTLRRAENGQYDVAPGSRSRAGSDASGVPQVSGQQRDRAPAASAPRESVGREPPKESRGRSDGRDREGGDARRGRESRRRPTRGRSGGRPATADAGEESRAASAGPSTSALRAAYDLLRRTVRGLSTGREAVRDSEVKRKILAEDDGFDETSLGFRKFSRFLQQAHDEGVIDLTQGEDGNYYLSDPQGADRAPDRRRDPSPERRPEPAPESRPEPSAAARTEPTPEQREGPQTREEPEPDMAATAAAAAGRARPPVEEEAASGAAEEGEDGAGRGLGRFRRGSRGAPGPDAATSSVGLGPVDIDGAPSSGEPDAAAGQAAGQAAGEQAGSQAGAPASGARSTGGRKGLGRFRRGSRGRGSGSGSGSGGGAAGGPAGPSTATSSADRPVTPGPVDVPGSATSDEPGDSGASAAGPPEAEPSTGGSYRATADAAYDPGPAPGEADTDPVAHMVRNYSGVGKRTAERLVEEFGQRVFEVIDREPERITRLLSEHRSRAVLEAREAERESGSARAG